MRLDENLQAFILHDKKIDTDFEDVEIDNLLAQINQLELRFEKTINPNAHQHHQSKIEKLDAIIKETIQELI